MKQTLKKLMYLLLVVSLILTSIPTAAFALPVSHEKLLRLQTQTVLIPDPMDPDQRIRTVETTTEIGSFAPLADVEYLTDTWEAGAILREAMKNRESTVTIPIEMHFDDSLQDIVDAICYAAMAHTGNPTEGDYIAKQRGAITASASYYPDSGEYQFLITFTLEYYTTAEQEARVDAAVQELLSSLHLDGMTDHEKVRAVYDWMCANITYDNANLNDPSYDLKYTAYAALIDRTSVCQGYAVLLYRLLLEMGIDCRVITGIGNGGPHAWNIVDLGGLYYNADATWDASWHQAGLDYNFFLRANDTFEDHIRDAEFDNDEFNAAYPMSQVDYTPPVVTEIGSGTCGENLTWVLTDDGTLTISGTGQMKSYSFLSSSLAPWYRHKENVKTVVIEEGVTSIGREAFDDCVNLTSITIPSTLTSIGEKAFDSQVELTAVYISDLAAWCNIDFLAGGQINNPLIYAENLYLKGQLVTELVIPDTVTKIGNYAFFGCSGLVSVTIPDSVTSIGESSFTGCSGLTGVTIPQSVVEIGGNAFSDCTGLSSVTISESVTSIGRGAFLGCTNLVSVTIPNSVVSIGEEAFANCPGLVFHEYDNAKYLGNAQNPYMALISGKDRDITSCTIHTDTKVIADGAFNYHRYLATVVIPEGISRIGDFTFRDCHSLRSVTIPNSVTSIGNSAFSLCKGLTDVTIGSGVTSIGEYAFYRCTSLVSVSIPENVISLGNYAFYECFGLTEATIASESIGDYAFCLCSGLTNVVLSDEVISIGEAAFNSCTSLISVVIGDHVSSIGYGAFGECTNLTVITIPATVTGIDSSAFYGCANLWHVLYQGTQIQWEAISGAFSEMTDLICHYNCTGREVTDAVNRICQICKPECEHTWDEGAVSLAPGCETVGEKTFTCTKCGQTYTEEMLPTGHLSTHVENAQAATCVADGYTGDIVCDACGVIVEHGSVINAAGRHERTSQVIKEPTCETDGEVRYTCVLCGDSYVETIDAVGHDYYEASNVSPTCTEDGSVTYTCSLCGHSYTDNIPATNHPYGWVINVVQVTCVTDGYSGDVVCADCGILLETGEVVPAGGHMFNGWEIVTEPTETTEGYEEHTCWVCGYTEGRTIAIIGDYANTMFFRADGVAYLYDANGELVNTYTGWMTEIYEIEDDYDINAGGYMTTAPWFFDTFEVTRVIIEDGVTPVSTAHWLDCFEFLTEVSLSSDITGIGDYMFHGCFSLPSISIPGSVTDIGQWAFEGCYELNEIVFEGNAPNIAADAFSSVTATAYYPAGNDTWTEAVMQDYGGDITWVAYGEDTPSCENGHSYEPVVTAPTCTEQGYTTYICSVCADRYVDDIVDPIGHSFSEWVVITAPTETRPGMEMRSCQTCGSTEEKTIPALGTGEYAQGTLVFCADGNAYLYGAGGVVEETFTGWMTDIYEMQNDYENDMMFITSPWYFSRDKITCVIIEDGVSPASTTLWFFSCRNLTSVSIGDGVTAIGNDAFFGCISLTGITIPGTVTSIGSFAFADATKLSEITFEGDAPSIGEYAFKDVTATAYYPAGNATWTNDVKQDYMGHIVWMPYGEELPPVCEGEHTFETVVVAPTCTEDGYTLYTCVNCGSAYVDNLTYAVGHSYSATVMAPTCTEGGYTLHTCAACGATYTDSHVEPIGHNYGSAVTAPTCTDQGYTTHTCAACGDSYVDTYVDALGHTWDDGVVTLEPTTTTEGKMVYTCTVCGGTKVEPIPKKESVIYDTPADGSVEIPENDCFEGGTTVTVEVVEEGDIYQQITAVMEEVAQVYTVFEFTATKDDAAVQPSGKLTVTFKIPEGYSTNAAVYYMDENGKLEKLEAIVDEENRTVTVELAHFSTYILTDENTAPGVLLGDVNGDGRVNARDARALLRFIAGLSEDGEVDEAAADYNGDSRINARDARAILQHIAGLD